MHGFKSFKINHPIVMTRDKKLRIKYPIVYRTRDILFRTRDPMVWKQGYKSLELGIQKFKPGIEKFRTSSNPMKSNENKKVQLASEETRSVPKVREGAPIHYWPNPEGSDCANQLGRVENKPSKTQ